MDIIQSAKRNVIFDATLMSGMACGRFFDLRFNRQLVQRSGRSNSLETGSIVHKGLEIYYKCIIERIPKKDAIGYAMAAAQMYIAGCIHCTDFTPTPDNPTPKCNHEPNEYPGVHATPPDSQGYTVGWKWVLFTLEQYFEHYKNDFWVPLEVETVKREIIYEDDTIRVMWKSKLDTIMDTNQAIVPMDHKTAKQDRETLDLNNQFMGQCFITKSRQIFINKIGFQTTKKPEEKFKRVPIIYTADRLLEWQSEIVPMQAYKLLEWAENEYYPPDFTRCDAKYGKCVFAEMCQADRNMRETILNVNFVVGPKWDPGSEDE